MSGSISFFDVKARHRRRDDLVEEAVATLNSIRAVLENDQDHRDLFNAIEAVKRLRRPEVVEKLDAERMAKAGSA